MRNIFFFDNMLTPKIITAVYWFLLLVAVGAGLSHMFDRYNGMTFSKFVTGLAVMAGVAIGARIWCELLIVLFKMNEALQDIRKK
jgi:hypothetical protein